MDVECEVPSDDILALDEALVKLEQKIPADVKEDLLRLSLQRVVELYEAWGKPEQASQWRDKAE